MGDYKFKFINNIKDQELISQISKMCQNADKDFVPPLSSRNSTSQTQFKVDLNHSDVSGYVEELMKQHIIIAYKKSLKDMELCGFLSYKKNFSIKVRDDESMITPNIYITTIIVDNSYRGQGITTAFYNKLFCKFPGRHFYTRTWSTNDIHIDLLNRLKFYELDRIRGDRPVGDNGEPVDTVYFHRMPAKTSFLQIVRQYGLNRELSMLFLILTLSIVFLILWMKSSEQLSKELWLAIFTSLGASLITLGTDSVLKYFQSKNDEHISALTTFGIDNISFNKDEVLETIIPRAKHELWISGYRLIMTTKNNFKDAIRRAAKNGKNSNFRIRVLLVSIYSNSFAYVYDGEVERTKANYESLYKLLCEIKTDYNIEIEVRFTIRPIFNDTYKVDDRFITSPFLHSVEKNERITAKDFYSIDVSDHNSLLYKRIESDYETIWNASKIRVKICPENTFDDFITFVEEETKKMQSKSLVQYSQLVNE
ncbi:MAG: hypothetical protein PUG74_11440 [Prevotellaceae bacterium]|nr:hypothetical protein [Prevotellaceae bacterium]